MDGAVQSAYPRKNWSSLMLFNCAHPSVRSLTPELVNREPYAGGWFFKLKLAQPAEAGKLMDPAAYTKQIAP